jgi:hypothetical protein
MVGRGFLGLSGLNLGGFEQARSHPHLAQKRARYGAPAFFTING